MTKLHETGGRENIQQGGEGRNQRRDECHYGGNAKPHKIRYVVIVKTVIVWTWLVETTVGGSQIWSPTSGREPKVPICT